MKKFLLIVLILSVVACQKSTQPGTLEKAGANADQQVNAVGENAASAGKHVAKETKEVASDAADKTADSAKKVGKNAESAVKHVGKETKKIASPTVFEQRGNIIKVKRTVFNQQLEKFRKDPTSFSPPSPPVSMSGNSGGMRPQTNPTQRKEFEQRMKDELKTNNNPIELK